MKISVSFLSSDYSFKETISRINNTSCDYIHIDYMDGKFVNNKSMTFNEIRNGLKETNKPLDVHLMVNNPSSLINEFGLLNTSYITIHYEIKNFIKYINEIKNIGIKSGLAINPETNIKDIEEYLADIDLVLVMSVNPGMGGQTFIDDTINKIKELDEIRKNNNYNFEISVDGGINNETILKLKELEIDIIVSGSYICKSNNYEEKIQKLK